ncbi:permease [Sphingomonas sp. Leaf357]|uniref:DMT family transporter n=1 Tax=Sphingomonas sp. Leaf357 TaxID=1736350 RepID=UPI0006F79BAF|nr:DMT family transporter [Sphingomonas sp. Leaf357]KQS01912.1 permease [Sphingomonas sp. Leaf357]
MANASPDRILLAIGLRLTSVLLFACMNTLIKLSEAGGATIGEILFFRQAGAAAFMVVVLLTGPGLRSVATSRLPAHILRMAMGLSAMALTFATILALPLAESTTIGFTMPIFATILGALVLGEPTGWHRWGAVVLGFVGVLIVAQPGTGHFPLIGALTGLGAALLTAGVSILLRQISRTESITTTVFWFSTLSLVPLGIVYAFAMQPHAPLVWLLLVGIGVIGGAAQLAMTGALRFGPVSVVVPMDYSSLLWATLSGWVVFGVLPDTWTWVGAPVIIASGLYIVWREHVRRRIETDQAVVEG